MILKVVLYTINTFPGKIIVKGSITYNYNQDLINNRFFITTKFEVCFGINDTRHNVGITLNQGQQH